LALKVELLPENHIPDDLKEIEITDSIFTSLCFYGADKKDVKAWKRMLEYFGVKCDKKIKKWEDDNGMNYSFKLLKQKIKNNGPSFGIILRMFKLKKIGYQSTEKITINPKTEKTNV